MFKLRESFQDVLCSRDYAERIVASFTNQKKSYYYGGNRSVSIEGYALEHFSELPQTEIKSSTKPCTRHAVFHSFFPDDSKQDAATTTAHSNRLIEFKKMMLVLSTIWENNDGCAEQYRCATALNLMSVLSQRHSIIFDRGISAPGHGKYLVDGINVIDNLYIYQLMSTVKLPGSKIFEKQIIMHSCTQKRMPVCLKSYKNIYIMMIRKHGVIDEGKDRKRASKRKYTERDYHVQDNADVAHK